MTTTIGFPGLGIADFAVNSTAFTIFGRPIAWYGIIIACGMVLAYLYANKKMQREGISTNDFLDIVIFTVPIAIVFARAFYVIFSLREYDSFYEMIAIWNGGISILGAVIGGALTIVCVTKFKKISTLKALDAMAPAVLIGQILGRWGNFVNAEVYGGATTLPWRMRITNDWVGTIEVHPLFLYESLWNLAGFIIINLIYKNKKYDGQIVLFYVFWYGLIRSMLELMRDDTYILRSGGLPVSFIISLTACVAALIIMIIKKFRKCEDKTV